MYTYCPYCETVFRIGPEQLKVAYGKVRCSQCHVVFNALESLIEQFPEEDLSGPRAPSEPAARAHGEIGERTDSGTQPKPVPTPAPVEPPRAKTSTSFNRGAINNTQTAPQKTHPEPLPVTTEAKSDQAKAKTSSPIQATSMGEEETRNATQVTKTPARETGQTRPGGREQLHYTPPEAPEASLHFILEENAQVRTLSWKGLGWTLGVGAMLLLLMGQYAWFARDELAQYSSLRPWLEHMCAIARCKLPLRRDLSRIVLKNRDLRTHPGRENALQLNFTLANEAPFVQPFPIVRLSLLDNSGQIRAMRAFQPHHYLGDDFDLTAGMPPHIPMHVSLDLVDIREHTTGFEITFQ
jgi:predicted Zn finger-like uncharacterized protein